MTNPPRTVADPANATIGRLSIVDADNDTVEVAATYPGHTTITLWTDPSGVDLTAAGARNLAATLTERADLIDGWCAGLVAVWVVRLVGRTRLGIVQKVTRARARRTPQTTPDQQQRPPDRCSKHHGTDHDGACRSCGKAREQAEQWDVDQRRAVAVAASNEAHERARLRQLAIAACPLRCAEHDGYNPNGTVCDHDPHLETRTTQGVAAVKAALAEARTTRTTAAQEATG